MAASSNIQFIEDSHRYYLGGLEVPNVTRILEPVSSDYGSVPFDVLERKRVIGELTHKATALYDAGLLDEDSVDETIAPYVDAWKKFVAESGFVPLAIEEIVFSKKYFYTGRLDRVGWLHQDLEGPLFTVDIKCREACPPDAGPQTSAYTNAFNETAEHKVTERRVVLLHDDGKYKCVTPPDSHNNDLAVFLACLTVYNHNAKYRR